MFLGADFFMQTNSCSITNFLFDSVFDHTPMSMRFATLADAMSSINCLKVQTAM